MTADPPTDPQRPAPEQGGTPPTAAANQPKTEPISPHGDRTDSVQGTSAGEGTGTPATDEASDGAARSAPTGSPDASPGDDVPEGDPGDAQGVSVGSTDAMAGTSEAAEPVDGVSVPSVEGHEVRAGGPAGGRSAVVGRGSAPDGEVSAT